MVTEANVGQLVQRTTDFELTLDEDERGLSGRLLAIGKLGCSVAWSDDTISHIAVNSIEVA